MSRLARARSALLWVSPPASLVVVAAGSGAGGEGGEGPEVGGVGEPLVSGVSGENDAMFA